MFLDEATVNKAITLARTLPVESPAEALLVAVELLERCAERLGRGEVRSELDRLLDELWPAES